MDQQATVIMTTVASAGDAERLATRLLEGDLAACVQEIPITSRYRWQGAVQHDAEILLLVKTAPAAAQAAMSVIEAHHPYDVPEILAVPATAGLPAYLEWLAGETVTGRAR